MNPMTLREAAEYLRVDRNTVGRLVRTGQLRHKRIGNRYVFREEWLIEFLETSGKAVTSPLSAKTRLVLAANKTAGLSASRSS